MASSSKDLIVIVGATGAQGGSVLDTFVHDKSYRIRAITRDSTSAKAQSLVSRSPNIEVVSADISDPSSLSRAFKEATAIFAVTDWTPIHQGLVSQSVTPPAGQTLNQYACTIETQYARNVFDVASTIPTLRRLVFSTLPYVSKESKGKYVHAYHFDSKSIAVEYLQETHPDLWKKTSLIMLGAYLENFISFPLFQPRREAETGEVVFEMLGSNEGPEMLLAFVVAGEDTGTVVKALVDQISAGKYVLAHRALMTMSQLVKVFEDCTGLKARVQYGKQLEGVPEDVKLQMENVFAYIKEFGYGLGDTSVITPKEIGLDLQFNTVEDWIRKQDWDVVLGP